MKRLTVWILHGKRSKTIWPKFSLGIQNVAHIVGGTVPTVQLAKMGWRRVCCPLRLHLSNSFKGCTVEKVSLEYFGHRIFCMLHLTVPHEQTQCWEYFLGIFCPLYHLNSRRVAIIKKTRFSQLLLKEDFSQYEVTNSTALLNWTYLTYGLPFAASRVIACTRRPTTCTYKPLTELIFRNVSQSNVTNLLL